MSEEDKRRNEILSKLGSMARVTTDPVHEKWLYQAIEYIKEKL